MSTPDHLQRSPNLNASLASTLLSLEQENTQITQSIGGHRWRFGIPMLDKEFPGGVLRGGEIVGVASSREMNSNNDLKVSISISISITATHMVDSAQRASRANVKPSAKPNVYIVTTPRDVTGTIKALHGAITRAQRWSTSTAETESTTADVLLGKVCVLQYLNMAGLAEVVGEVSAGLSGDGKVEGGGERERERTVVLIQGLSGVVAESQRRSGAVQTAALLAGVLANLGNLRRRGCGGVLVLLEMEAGWVGVSSTSTGAGAGADRSVRSAGVSPGSVSRSVNEKVLLESSFASSAGKVLKATGVGSVQAKLIEEVCGCIIVVHDASGRVRDGVVVEVVKGEVGFGAWSYITK